MISTDSFQTEQSSPFSSIEVKTDLNSETVYLKPGAVLYGRKYAGFNVYLVSGQAELSYRGCVDKLMIGENTSLKSNGIFNIYDHGQYLRCVTDCELLIVNKVHVAKSNEPSLIEGIDSESSLLDHSTDDWNIHPFSKIGTEKSQRKLPENIINDIKTLALDRKHDYEILGKKYTKLKLINKKLITLLVNKDKEIKKNAANSSNESKVSKVLDSDEVKKLNNISIFDEDDSSKSVEHLIERNVPSFFKGMIQFIQSNMESAATLAKKIKSTKANNKFFANKENHKVKQHDWLRMNEAYPMKSGMYYISDGKSVAVSYFNKDRKVFHMTSELDIRYWSTKIVTLPQ